MHQITSLECSRIAQDLQIRKLQVESVVQLLDEGNTVPFITRYRKERTGGLKEDALRQIQTRVNFLRSLNDRKQTILKSIETQGKLTEELRRAILSADTTKRLEDLYLPYKQKKKSLALAARDKGLEPLALAIWNRDPVLGNLEELWPTLLNPEKQLNSVDDIQLGVQHIHAEMISDTADVRAAVRSFLWETGQIKSAKSDKLAEGQGTEFKDYFDFRESLRQIPAHRILALNRGEKENALKVSFEYDKDIAVKVARHALAESLLHRANAPVIATPLPPAPVELPAAPVESSSEMPASPVGEPSAPAPEIAAPAPHPETAPLVSTLTPTAPGETPAAPGDPLADGVDYRTPHSAVLQRAIDDALTRLILPSLEREVRAELTDEAEMHAVHVFARNLKSLLLQPPLRNRKVVAIDPAIRTGCKLVALDEFGNVLEHSVIYPFGSPQRRGRERKKPDAPPAAVEAPLQEAPPVDAALAATGEAPAAELSSPPEAPVSRETERGPDASAEATPIEPAAEPAADAPNAETQPPAAESTAPTESTAPEIPVDKKTEAKSHLKDFIAKHQAHVVALGNGTGCRETEEMVSDLIASDFSALEYVIVNEAGASHYSVSVVAKEEFPNLDSTVRGTISIGRRLQDPLSELVKVDPPNIGVGLYQHDVGRKELRETLDAVVESCVNQVGVDVNTASIPLLRHVSGLNQMVARELVEYRQKNGPFTSREQLLQVSGMGPQRYVQSAGFLKIPQGSHPFDKTSIHPESYEVAQRILEKLGFSPQVLDDKSAQDELQNKLKTLNPEEVARELSVGLENPIGPPTVFDILDALSKPGRDPREDLPPPIFKKGILKIEDLQPGMELKGTVLNVVDFGAFVDVGLKDSGLVHISEMANRYIKSPYDVVAVNDVVIVWVKQLDKDRHRVSLTMIQPGTERKPGERRPERGRPSRERRPDRPTQGEAPPSGDQQRSPGGDRDRGNRNDRSGDRRPPQRGRGPGPGGRRDQRAPAGPPAENLQKAPPPTVPPRRPRREPPKPQLTQAAIEGKASLRTFGELAALLKLKEEPAPKKETATDAPAAEAPPENAGPV